MVSALARLALPVSEMVAPETTVIEPLPAWEEAPLSVSVPALTVVPPPYVFDAERIRSPPPDLVSEKAPLTTPLIASVPPVAVSTVWLPVSVMASPTVDVPEE